MSCFRKMELNYSFQKNQIGQLFFKDMHQKSLLPSFRFMDNLSNLMKGKLDDNILHLSIEDMQAINKSSDNFQRQYFSSVLLNREELRNMESPFKSIEGYQNNEMDDELRCTEEVGAL